jgi:TrmH family RNA methyltransferase
MAIKAVTSRDNPEIKRIRALAQRKHREEDAVFLTEGLRHALEAAETGWSFETVVIEDEAQNHPLVKKLLALVEKQKCYCLSVPPKLMESIAKRDNAQAVVAVIKQRWHPLKEVKSGLWVALEEIRDPGNLGTIMRTADAVGAKGIILIGNTCDPYSLEAIRASMGSFPHVALVRCNVEEFTVFAGSKKFNIVGTHLKATHDYRQLDYGNDCILLMGNEQAGLTEGLTAVCTARVKIPMQGKADSLNVAVATAVVLYEAQRKKLALSC